MQATGQFFFVLFTLMIEAGNCCETLVMLLLVTPCPSVGVSVPKDRISFIFRFEDSRP
jgi:hypothetical protein